MSDESTLDLILTRSARVVMTGILILGALRLLKTFEMGLLKLTHFKRRGSDHLGQLTEKEKRLSTVLKVIGTATRVMILLFGVVMVMKELGFDITPLLTGAGIAGVAIGFGSQSLVKDVISGIFLLLEDQIRIGDNVRIGTLFGTVERMELRVTVLRDVDGTLHIIPNGEIKAVSNMSYQWGRAVVDIPLSYFADVEKAVEVVKSVCDAAYETGDLKQLMLEPPAVQALTEFSSTEMKIRILAKTGPDDRLRVQQNLRLRIKKAFDQSQIPLVGMVDAPELTASKS